MKKNIYKVLALFMVVATLGSCTKGFEEMNQNPNAPEAVPTSYLMTNAQYHLTVELRDNWFNGRMGLVYSQYWSQINYTDESRYSPRVNVTNNSWYSMYTNLYDLQDIILKNTDTEAFASSGYPANQIAVAKIMKAYVFQIMVDTWGDIPYFDALKGVEMTTPKYDSASAIYADLLKELEEASSMIDADQPGMKGDVIYGGDMTKWKKFANSLIMRIALREGKTDVAKNAASKAFMSNADNAQFAYTSSGKTVNPIFDDFVNGNRLEKDFAVSKTLLDYMNGNNDPRRPFYATPHAENGFAGLTYGLDNGNAPNEYAEGRCYQALNIYAADAVTPWMNYDEVLFILAEINNDETKFREGIEASATNWGASSEDAATLAAAVPFNGKESIVTEKWVANYMQGVQGWAEYRRTGFPSFFEGPADGPHAAANVGSLIVPNRRPYPTDESQLNKENYDAAVSSIGGPDKEQQAKMFWQK
ncbi:MAG: SusD/RagB family nutrient-binding outer membrane lipoprotein [Flavobacteriales bacterium]|nr:SusD/RagB family nutrient-binding outer membrane lipoprotein [Flavobacteriales bacterium]